jgi:uncharacterized Zn-finger protein
MGRDHKDLSPLSAAVARQKAGLDPYDEDPLLIPTEFAKCPQCGRSFQADRLEKHLGICQRVAKNEKARREKLSENRQKSQGATLAIPPHEANLMCDTASADTASADTASDNSGEMTAKPSNAKTIKGQFGPAAINGHALRGRNALDDDLERAIRSQAVLGALSLAPGSSCISESKGLFARCCACVPARASLPNT